MRTSSFIYNFVSTPTWCFTTGKIKSLSEMVVFFSEHRFNLSKFKSNLQKCQEALQVAMMVVWVVSRPVATLPSRNGQTSSYSCGIPQTKPSWEEVERAGVSMLNCLWVAKLFFAFFTILYHCLFSVYNSGLLNAKLFVRTAS